MKSVLKINTQEKVLSWDESSTILSETSLSLYSVTIFQQSCPLDVFTYVMRMAWNEILSLIMSLIWAISGYFSDILNDINNKILQEFSIFCMINSFKCRAYFFEQDFECHYL